MMRGTIIIHPSDHYKNQWCVMATTNEIVQVSAWNIILRDNLNKTQAWDLLTRLQTAFIDGCQNFAKETV